MALKVLLLRKQRDTLSREREGLQEARDGFDARESELAEAIKELADDATDEEKAAVDEAVNAFEAEKADTDAKIADLDERISAIESEIEAEEAKQGGKPAPEPEAGRDDEEGEGEERSQKGIIEMQTRNKFFGMDAMQTREMFEREDVKSFLTEVRTVMTEKRAINGGNLLVPEVFLGLIRENIMDYSKLYKHVNVRSINGQGTVVVMGTIPEAVWTDCCANLNELDLTFNNAEVACWRVGGYFDICNATLEDSDIDLAAEILTVLGQAIGMALDKAILFGLGTRMPLGVFTRLAQTSQPEDYPATARPWVDLHETNIKTIESSVTGIDMFREFLLDTAAAKGKYSRGTKVWTMNENTYTSIVAASMTIDAGGAIVAGVNGVMPVIGGVIEVLEFLPDDVILGGYFDLYLLAERAGTRLDQSEHVRFIEDRTVFKGTARYDGTPVIAEGFVAIGINGTTPSAAGISFAPDKANAQDSE